VVAAAAALAAAAAVVAAAAVAVAAVAVATVAAAPGGGPRSSRRSSTSATVTMKYPTFTRCARPQCRRITEPLVLTTLQPQPLQLQPSWTRPRPWPRRTTSASPSTTHFCPPLTPVHLDHLLAAPQIDCRHRDHEVPKYRAFSPKTLRGPHA
jgi:hypothetical protein